MVWLVAIWTLLFAVFIGWGLLAIWVLARAGGNRFRGDLSTFVTMWLGYGALLAVLQLVSLLHPIDTTVFVVSLIPAIAGFVLQRDVVVTRLRRLKHRPRTLGVTIVVSTVAIATVAYAAFDLVRWYDTGLYHLQMVKWNAEYAAVPGLANLHLRFGYNNSVHVFGAYVDAIWQGVACHLVNGFFMSAVLAHWFAEIFGARTPRGRLRQAFCLMTLPFLLAKLWTIEVASFSSDLPLAITSFVVALEVISLPRSSSSSKDRLLLPLAAIVTLGAVALVTKLGGLAIFGVTGILAVVLVARGTTWRMRIALLAVPFALVIGWLARGVVLSGWLVFPAFGKLGLSWAVRTHIAKPHLMEIESWARMFGKGPSEVFGHGTWHWLGPWLGQFAKTHEVVLAAASFVLLAWRIAFGAASSALGTAAGRAATTMGVLGIAQWFISAPDLRYGGFLFWMLFAAVSAPLLAPYLRPAGIFVLALSLAITAWNGGFEVRPNAVTPSLFGRPTDAESPPTEMVEAGPGTRVHFPTNSDQCFDAPLPCSPSPGKATLRDPASLGGGFLPSPHAR